MTSEHRLHLYTGDGKGKTTAAMGLALRMLGHGGRVLVASFLKDGTSGELTSLARLGAVMATTAPMEGFLFQMTPEERAREAQRQTAAALRLIEQVREARPLLTVLDELALAVSLGVVQEDAALRLVDEALRWGECVVTGRDAPACLRHRADYASVIAAEKHPYSTEGLTAREGIEW